MTTIPEVVKYKLSGDNKELLAYLAGGTYYHIQSKEFTMLEKWIKKLLRGKK